VNIYAQPITLVLPTCVHHYVGPYERQTLKRGNGTDKYIVPRNVFLYTTEILHTDTLWYSGVSASTRWQWRLLPFVDRVPEWVRRSYGRILARL